MNLKIGDLVMQGGDHLGMIIQVLEDKYRIEWYGCKDSPAYMFNYNTFITEGFRRRYMTYRKWI